MNTSDKSILAYIYYRDLPNALISFVSSQKCLSYTKDGVLKGAGHSCPRLTIRCKVSEADDDKVLRNRLSLLLGELEANNQIVSFSIYG